MKELDSILLSLVFFLFYCIIRKNFFCDGTLKGIEAMNVVKKGQVNNLNYSVLNEVKYINQLFGIVL